MISLHVYLTPKTGRDLDLKTAICDYWLPAMQKQPGFINAALLNPFTESHLKSLQAIKPKPEFEIVCFWSSEQQRLSWVDRPIHDEVFSKVIDASDDVSYTLQNVIESWEVN